MLYHQSYSVYMYMYLYIVDCF